MLAGVLAGMHVRISAPEGYQPSPQVVSRAVAIGRETGGSVTVYVDPRDAVEGADVVATDTWVSMGKEEEQVLREKQFGDWRLTEELMALAASDAIVLHCLPAYRGKEISAEVLDGPQSVVWDQAENRRHVQKAVIAHLVAP